MKLFAVICMLFVLAVSSTASAASDNFTQSSAPCKTLTSPPVYLDGELHIPTCDLNGNLITGSGAGTSNAPYIFTPKANQQTLVLSGSAQGLTVPTGAKYADFFPEGAPGTNNKCLRYRDDGTNPTASVGSGLDPDQLLLGYSGSLSAIKFINATGATCTLTINYYS